MISLISWQLLAVLMIAALLGLLIGLSGMRLHQARREKEAYNSQKAVIDKMAAELEDLITDKARILQVLESEKKLGGLVRGKNEQLASQQETLKAHSDLQAQRISKLDAELHVAEEKSIRLERDFASFKANKQREVRMLKINPDGRLDNEELPVLKKKVEKASSDRAAFRKANTLRMDMGTSESYADQTQPIIAKELDIPSLAESELPDSVEELEFELASIHD